MFFQSKINAGQRKSKLLAVCLLGGSALALSACDRQPEGQVVAVVNGEEITQQELNSALGNTQMPEGEAAETVRNQALANVINRRLMAGVAREEGIDATPEFIVKRREVEDALLVQLLSQQVAKDLKQPSAEEIDAFIAENPQMFANRTLMAVDQIRFQQPDTTDYLEPLGEVTTMDQAVAVLNRLGIQFERGNTRIDSATLPADMFAQVQEVGSREPIIVPGRIVTVSQIMQMREAPIPEENQRPLATNAVRQRAVADALRERLDQAKEGAGIDYQPGFGPPEDGSEPEIGTETPEEMIPAE